MASGNIYNTGHQQTLYPIGAYGLSCQLREVGDVITVFLGGTLTQDITTNVALVIASIGSSILPQIVYTSVQKWVQITTNANGQLQIVGVGQNIPSGTYIELSFTTITNR